MRKWFIRAAMALSFVALPLSPASAEELAIAAASSLQDPLREIAKRFESESGHQVRMSFASSGKLYHQIANGAPFDLFFSADTLYPQKLKEAGLGTETYRYGHGRIVLWASNQSFVSVGMGLDALKNPKIRKIAIANPHVAPYGRAAMEVLERKGLLPLVKRKLVRGENIAQAAQFAQTRAADVGILSLSLARSPQLAPAGQYWIIPESLYNPIESDAIIVAPSEKQAIAEEFIAFCKGPQGERIWIRYGLARLLKR